ncbi:MAG: response regulator [Pseudohongiellaceae bacterium]
MPLTKLKVLLIDDHYLFLEGMHRLLANVVTEVIPFGDAEAALQDLSALNPDLVLIDLSMPGMDGLSFIKAVEARQLLIPVAVLSATENISEIRKVLRAGAFGFIPKSANRESLLEALTVIIGGQVYVPEDIAIRLPTRGVDEGKDSYGLSPRQIQILELVAKGYPNKKISLILYIKDETVKTHLRNIFQILAVNTRTEAVARALELNLLEN